MDQRSYKLWKIVDDNIHAIDVWHLIIPKMWLRNFSTIQDKKKTHDFEFITLYCTKSVLTIVLTTHCYFEKWFPKYQNMMYVGEGVVNSDNSKLIIIQNRKVKIWNKMTPKGHMNTQKIWCQQIFQGLKFNSIFKWQFKRPISLWFQQIKGALKCLAEGVSGKLYNKVDNQIFVTFESHPILIWIPKSIM